MLIQLNQFLDCIILLRTQQFIYYKSDRDICERKKTPHKSKQIKTLICKKIQLAFSVLSTNSIFPSLESIISTYSLPSQFP